MIIEKFTTGKVYTMKLVTGEEIITRLTEDGALGYVVSKPLVLSVTAQGVAMTPFLFTAEINNDITIPKSAVIAVASTDSQTAGQYIKGTTGIVPASVGVISKLK
jgi:hypothetical protein